MSEEKFSFSNFDSEFVVSENELLKQNKLFDELTFEKHVINGVEKKVPLIRSFALRPIVRRIATHNKNAQFTGIIILGQSGSGKSTLTAKIVEILQDEGYFYKVHWLNALDAFKRMDDIINSLQKGIPHLLVLSDASYTDREVSTQKELAQIAYKLTTIRHTVKARVMVIIQIHYSKAMQKFFRNQHFTFVTSMGSEEHQNLQDLFGKQNQYLLKTFNRSIRSQMVNGYFTTGHPKRMDKVIKYETDKPFRLALVDELGWVHRCLYSKPTRDVEHGVGEYLTVKDVLQTLNKKYRLRDIHHTLRWMAMIHGGLSDMALVRTHRYPFRLLVKLMDRTDIDWKAFMEELERMLSLKKQSRSYKHYKKSHEEILAEVDEKINAMKNDGDMILPPAK